MVSVGYALSCAEFGPHELVHQARLAEGAGFERLWISDHAHPGIGGGGPSPFVWSVVGALSEAVSLPVTAAVDVPTVRTHAAIIAQAAATAAVQLDGRFVLGVGSGETLDEPSRTTRSAEVEEAVGLIRLVHGAAVPVPVYVCGSDLHGADLAARIGDGYCTATPDPDLVERFRFGGDPARPVQCGLTVHRAGTDEHIAAVRSYADAGIDEVYVQQIGGDHNEFFRIWADSVLPAFG